MPSSVNPYESPREASERPWPVPADPAAPARVQLVERGWHYRRLTLEGRLEAEVEWNARWPKERLAVNGRIVHEQFAYLYNPHFEAILETSQGPCSISLDVRLIWWLSIFNIDRLESLRLTIDGNVVYQE